jgi:hypothetical protein
MHTNRSLFGIACRSAAFTFLVAGTSSLMHAQQAAAPVSKAPFFLASSAVPDFTSLVSDNSTSSSSSDDAVSDSFDPSSPAPDSSQPPPRRRYGRPSYSGGNTNPDGSPKYTFMAGAGAAVPVGITHRYDTPSWDFQVGGGRNFSKSVGVLLQFDYDHLGLQGATLANQQYIYNYGCSGSCTPITGLDGNAHIWSFTLDPTFTLATEGSVGAYAVVGAGFYHKVTNFTLPTTGTYCDFFYGCYQYTSNQVVDHYTSNAAGVNAGIGLTYKFSKFSNERFYVEGRYVVVFDQYKKGYTSANIGTAPFTATNLYPANSDRTSYIPITFGLRF